MTNDFMDELNGKLFEDERLFKFKNVTVDNQKKAKLELIISHDDYREKLDEKLRKKVLTIAENIMPSGFSVTVDYIIAVHDENTLVRLMLEYIQRERPNFYSLFAVVPVQVEFNNNLVTVTITLEKFMHDYALESKLNEDLVRFFDTVVLEEVEVVLQEIPNSEGAEIKQTEYVADPVRVIEVHPIRCYTRNEFTPVRYICDVKDKETSSVTVCGAISGIKEKFIEKIGKTIFSFTLNDTTDTMKAKYFAKSNNNFDWKDVFADGETLMLSGAIQYDKFDNCLVLSVYRVASCAVNYDTIDVKSNFNKEYSDYRYIFPEPYHDVEQDNLFDTGDISERLKENVYCAFDLETTGLDVFSDEIIEIGAIKIVNGRFTESFSTFVRPSKTIPPVVVEKTGIKNEDVALAPLPQDVIPDFYRFCKGCIFVGHNIVSFDIPLLNNNAVKYKYEFKNDAVDTLTMARNVFPNGKCRLIDVCNRLGIPLEGAHRAVNDVAANAKVFLKLLKMQK